MKAPSRISSSGLQMSRHCPPIMPQFSDPTARDGVVIKTSKTINISFMVPPLRPHFIKPLSGNCRRLWVDSIIAERTKMKRRKKKRLEV
jgi:hypothetical protein